MHSFSVGSVAAIINAVVAILQLVLPNILILALVATLSDTHSAVTWSVVGRSIHSSNWPLLLRADSAATKHVQISSAIITLLRPIALGLVAIAAIVTPLGLYEDIQPASGTRLVDFVRQTDAGPFGSLTPPRSGLGFSRGCSDFAGGLPGQCPGTTTVIKYSDDGNVFNATIVNDDYDRRIPAQLAELYQSGLSSQPLSISSFFDIEWRWYNKHTQDNIGNQSYVVDSYYPIATVIGDGDVKLIEGLIVDTRNGGIGFRSHTIPMDTEMPYGAEWEEDILFLVPETACVDTNVTLEHKIPSEDEFLTQPTQNIVDQGGFAQISRYNPWDDGWYGDTQRDPKLRARAYRAGWTMNFLNMYFFGVSEPFNFTAPIESHVEKRYPVNNTLSTDSSAGAGGMMSLATLSLEPYDGLVGVPATPFTFANGSAISSESDLQLTFRNGSALPGDSDTYMSDMSMSIWPNPYNITTDNYTTANVGCTAFADGDWVNSTNIQVKCGIVLGPANKTGGSDSPLVEPGSVWTRPVYTCASTTKATIRTVRFSFNQTRGPGLDSLAVRSIADKKYASEAELPTWGVETPNMTLASMTPFWGLIDPQLADAVNLTTIRAPHVYIPASSAANWLTGLYVGGGTSYMPGTAAPATIWQSTYGLRDLYNELQDLSGKTSLALASRWKEMSTTETGTASIMNLVWTDFAANALIGTRGWLSTKSSLPPNLQGTPLRKRDNTPSSSADTRVPVYVYQRVVRYRWIYGIPAAMALLLAGVIGLVALAAVVSGKGSISRIRYYLDRLSAGRLLVALKRGEHDFDSDTKGWLATSGSRQLGLPASGYAPVLSLQHYAVEPKRDVDHSQSSFSGSDDRRLMNH